jgi:hypothetical protein
MALAARPHLGAFDQGIAPRIACVNKATVDMQCDYSRMTNALQAFITEAFAPVWGTPAELIMADEEVEGAWTLLFIDDADEAGALGYHDLTANGLPLSKIFVKTALEAGEVVSVTASHEIAEMLVDPAISTWILDNDQVFWALETADAVEADTFEIDGIMMSDFVYPSYFENFRKPNSTRFDYLKKIVRPFQILQGGYSLVIKNGEMQQIFGSQQKAEHFQTEDRRLHRSEYRRALVEKKPIDDFV